MAKSIASIRCGTALIILGLGIPGCHLLRGPRIEEPLSYTEQAAEIRKIVPVGTERGDAVKRLGDAGIAGEFSRVGRSIYYCHLLNPKGSSMRRHMNIALLFDQDGRFYATRPADSDSSTVSGAAASTASGGKPRNGPAMRPSTESTNRAVTSTRDSDRATQPKRRGDGHRSPFYDPNNP